MSVVRSSTLLQFVTPRASNTSCIFFCASAIEGKACPTDAEMMFAAFSKSTFFGNDTSAA